MKKITTYVDRKIEDNQRIAKVRAQYGSLRTYRRVWKRNFEAKHKCKLSFDNEQHYCGKEIAAFYTKT